MHHEAKQSSRVWILMIATCLTAIQIFGLAIVGGQSSLLDSYLKFCRWDCGAFARIAEQGYPLEISYPPPPYHDLGHFPGLPILTNIVHFLLPGPLKVSWFMVTVLTSEIATIGIWTYILLLISRILKLDSHKDLRWFAALMILSYPQSFLLVAGYSESVFLFGLLRFLYWFSIPGKKSGALCVFHGIVMCSARMVGLPLVVLPLILKLLSGEPSNTSRTWKFYVRPTFVGLVSASGSVGYFLFCQIRYGHWDMYFRALESGWKMSPDFKFLFEARNYQLPFPTFRDATSMNEFSFPVISVFLILIVLLEFGQFMIRDTIGEKDRLIFYVAAVLLWFFSGAGASHLGMQSMIRYGLCVYVMALHGFLPQIAWIGTHNEWSRDIGFLFAILLIAIFLLLQGNFAYLYINNAWIG